MNTTEVRGAVANPFFVTERDRAALARERYFERGERPSGLLPEPIIQSWSRCLGAHRSPDERIAFEPVSNIRVSTALTKSRALLCAAHDSMAELQAAIAGTPVRALLTNCEGVVVLASLPSGTESCLMQAAARVGVSLGESGCGTGAPGVAAYTGEVSLVRGGEHFFRCLESLYCAAAPIRDASGRVAAVLDLSSDEGPFRFDAARIVRAHATIIENRLLADTAGAPLLLRFQSSRSMFHTPLEGLAGVDDSGRVLWFNDAGASLFGCARVPAPSAEAGGVFGLDLQSLLALAHDGRARSQPLPSGLTLWMEARLDERAHDKLRSMCAATAAPPAEPARIAAPTLHEVNRGLIEQALGQCKGNVSRAALMLGVSRGLLYRRLHAWGLSAKGGGRG